MKFYFYSKANFIQICFTDDKDNQLYTNNNKNANTLAHAASNTAPAEISFAILTKLENLFLV